jgi:alpha-D-xyloside xylohydrolase
MRWQAPWSRLRADREEHVRRQELARKEAYVGSFSVRDGGLEWSGHHEVVRVEPWGADSLRVRAGYRPLRDDLPGALLPAPDQEPKTAVNEAQARITNGALTAEVSAEGHLRFTRTDTGAELLAEDPAHFWWPGPRQYVPTGGGYRLEQRFRAYDGERLYGLGQHTHGLLDQKGAVIDLVQRNAEVSIPFLLSSRGYGFLWNNPAVGRVELAHTGTRWVADSARQIDYWVTVADAPAAILGRYADATGHAPMLPEWAAGFWQSKLRYRTQQELLDVVREHHRRGLPLSVVVADFFHWPRLGDWRFDPAEWPDPAAMIRELTDLGVKLMVSVWPSVSALSENYQEMADKGLLVATENGIPFHTTWWEKGYPTVQPVAFYDPTDPAARAFVWDQVREHYYDLGVRVWWLDACEPEMRPAHPHNLRYRAGAGSEVANLYPQQQARAFYEGMRAAGETEIVSLCRSAWAGSQRYGAAVWSGDIGTTFETLAQQVRAGLNIALSGIPWWTTDIGGFHGGDPNDAHYRELIVRWFQYGVFCPLFRLHGHREPRERVDSTMVGGPNEVWSFGEDAYQVIREQLGLRERLRPYLMAQMRAAHTAGIPPMRPLFVDFPDDPAAWDTDDQFLLGPDVLVAPVLQRGARERAVYLPAGVRWVDAWTGQETDGAQTVTAPAPLAHIPVYLRAGSDTSLRNSFGHRG